MSKINYGLVGKLQRREKFRRQNENKINSYLLTYCENYDKRVENVAQFMQNTKKQIFEDLWQQHLNRVAESKASRAKKKEADQQSNQQE